MQAHFSSGPLINLQNPKITMLLGIFLFRTEEIKVLLYRMITFSAATGEPAAKVSLKIQGKRYLLNSETMHKFNLFNFFLENSSLSVLNLPSKHLKTPLSTIFVLSHQGATREPVREAGLPAADARERAAQGHHQVLVQDRRHRGRRQRHCPALG
jgi:hypothetical protein